MSQLTDEQNKAVDSKITGGLEAVRDHFNKELEEIKAENAQLREFVKKSGDEGAQRAFAAGEHKQHRGSCPEETLDNLRQANGVRMVGSGLGRAPMRAADAVGLDAIRVMRANVLAAHTNRDVLEIARAWEDPILEANLERQRALVKQATGLPGPERSAALRALNTESVGSGGAYVEVALASQIIQLLTPKTVIRRAGIQTLPLVSGKARLPFMSEGIQAYYTKECAGPNASYPKEGEILVDRKILTALICMCEEWMDEANYNMDVEMRNELIRAMSLREDVAFIRGDGLEGSPFGLSYYADLADNARLASDISALGPIDKIQAILDDLTDMMACLSCSDVPAENRVWIMNCRTKHALLRCLDSNGNRVFFDELMNDRLLGYPVYDTTHIPTTLDASGNGTNDETEMYFADIGHMRLFETQSIKTDLFRDATFRGPKGNTVHGINERVAVMRAQSSHDLALYQRGAEVCKLEGVRWGVR